MLSFGMIMNVLLRANLSIAIVEMTSSTNITDGNVTYTQVSCYNYFFFFKCAPSIYFKCKNSLNKILNKNYLKK